MEENKNFVELVDGLVNRKFHHVKNGLGRRGLSVFKNEKLNFMVTVYKGKHIIVKVFKGIDTHEAWQSGPLFIYNLNTGTFFAPDTDVEYNPYALMQLIIWNTEFLDLFCDISEQAIFKKAASRFVMSEEMTNRFIERLEIPNVDEDSAVPDDANRDDSGIGSVLEENSDSNNTEELDDEDENNLLGVEGNVSNKSDVNVSYINKTYVLEHVNDNVLSDFIGLLSTFGKRIHDIGGIKRTQWISGVIGLSNYKTFKHTMVKDHCKAKGQITWFVLSFGNIYVVQKETKKKLNKMIIQYTNRVLAVDFNKDLDVKKIHARMSSLEKLNFSETSCTLRYMYNYINTIIATTKE